MVTVIGGRSTARPTAAGRADAGGAAPGRGDDPSVRATQADEASRLTGEAAAAGEDIDCCLDLARRWGRRIPPPGDGRTALRWCLLSAAAAGDLTAARVVEPHVDALAILHEAGVPAPSGVWGVFAAEAPGSRLDGLEDGGRWTLHGRKAWCSLGDRLDRALVTAHTGAGRRLFAVDLHHAGVTARPGTWVARGLRAVDSGPVDFREVPADPVGAAGWYLDRPGFAWGAIGVAACWAGGASALVTTLRDTLSARPPDPVRAVGLGAADAAGHAAACALAAAARAVDDGRADGDRGLLLAERTRAVVHDAAERILREVGHALGPAPLAFDEIHARRVADLELYLRQHHGDRDLARLGASLLEEGASG